MIKSLSLLIVTTALTVSAWGADDVRIRVQKVSKCKKSSHSQGDYLIKECPKQLSYTERIVISGASFKMTKKKTEKRLELLVLDKRGANYYMGLGVKNSTFEPVGNIQIIRKGATDKALIYKLKYSEYDSSDTYFRMITVRLRSNLIGARKTCIVAASDSQDDKVKLTDKGSAKNLEKYYRQLAMNFISGKEFAKAKCAEYVHSN